MLALRGCCRRLLASTAQHSQSLSTTCTARGLEELIPPIPSKDSVEPVKSGRAWKAAELRLKSFEDLHKLWWVLLKERNYLNAERMLYRAQGQEMPGAIRLTLGALRQVRKSMARIKLVLSERAKAEPDLSKRQELKDMINAD